MKKQGVVTGFFERGILGDTPVLLFSEFQLNLST
jgi:hypothetical protein